MKRSLFVLLIALLICALVCGSASATQTDSDSGDSAAESESPQNSETTGDGNTGTDSQSGTGAPFKVNAEAAILIDASSGRVLYEQNPHERMAPASTTKILTALLVLENVDDLSATVTLPADFDNVGESSIYLEPGETITYESLLYALMLRSANDAAQALAIGVAGSEEQFVEMMNVRSEELGLKDSHWANPHGLDAPQHYTSAYDLAMLSKAAIQIPKFNELIKTTSYTLPWADYEYDRVIYNHNQFLDMYEGADGIKTGFTDDAGSCLVGSVTRNDMRLIGVVLKAAENDEHNGHYAAMTSLMDYGFESYTSKVLGTKGQVVGSIPISGAKVKSVDVVLGSDVMMPVMTQSNYEPQSTFDYPKSLQAPVSKEEPIGHATYIGEDGNIVTVDLYLAESLDRYTFATVLKQVWDKFISALL
ncbi:MAG: D-alanyl-D-alanine carboxypeptidase [Firmicutes bacterium]|nr:D-alanyl-D-alanine carboxypeptidase [Bacillota bacterium]